MDPIVAGWFCNDSYAGNARTDSSAEVIVSTASLSIVIVNWNAGPHLRECILSIQRMSRDGFALSDVVIVDNGSTDGSLMTIDQSSVPVRIIRNDENRGFAVACNQGAAATNGDYLLFLNPDTCLFEDSISKSVTFMERSENMHVGICGIQLVDESNRECMSYATFPTLGRFIKQAFGIKKIIDGHGTEIGKDISKHPGVLEVDQVIGAFFMVRQTVFNQLKGFDERFFVYFEEVDFAFRAYLKGWKSVCLTGVKCIHVGGGTSRQVKAARLFYSLRSRLLYSFKHYSPFFAMALLVVTMVPEFLSRLVYSTARGGWHEAWDTIHGYAMLLKDMPAIIRSSLRMRRQDRQNR